MSDFLDDYSFKTPRLTVSDLQLEVDRLNDKYCKDLPNHLVVHRSNGGYDVILTGREDDMFRYGLCSEPVSICNGHDTLRNTINDLYRRDSYGQVKSAVKNAFDKYGYRKVRKY